MGKFLTRSYALVLLALVSCTQQYDDGKLLVLHVAQRTDLATWDPAAANDRVTLSALGNIYESLYQYAYLAETYKVVPLLAADFPKFSADRLTVTIPIQHGIFYQNDPSFKETH